MKSTFKCCRFTSKGIESRS